MSYYSECRGVIHVGANGGDERHEYAKYDLNVIWFEPIPEVFQQLQSNISGYPKHRAFQLLVTDKDKETYTLNVTNNNGQSSSIFDLYKHKDIWPDIHVVRTVEAKSTTLDTFMKWENAANFQALVVDVQGAELLVLKGARETLKHINYVKIEFSNMELYKNSCFENEVVDFLTQQGFLELGRNDFISTPEGTVSEVHYKRVL